MENKKKDTNEYERARSAAFNMGNCVFNLPDAAAKVPATHEVHVVDRPIAHCPATHAVHAEAPALAPVAKRAGHAMHVAASTAPIAAL